MKSFITVYSESYHQAQKGGGTSLNLQELFSGKGYSSNSYCISRVKENTAGGIET